MSAAESTALCKAPLAHHECRKSGGTKILALIGIRPTGRALAQANRPCHARIEGVDVPVGTLDITLYRDDLSKVALQGLLQSSEYLLRCGPANGRLVLSPIDVLYTGRTIAPP